MDGLGSNIRVDSRGREVMRILPRNHDGVNEEWISDKTRAVVDGLKRKRLDRPYMRGGGKLEEVSWYDAFNEIAARVARSADGKIGAIAGDLGAVEEMFALKTLLDKLGSPHRDCRQLGAKLHPKHGRASYLFNSTIAGVDSRRCSPPDRDQSPPRSSCPECAHPQSLAAKSREDRARSARRRI